MAGEENTAPPSVNWKNLRCAEENITITPNLRRAELSKSRDSYFRTIMEEKDVIEASPKGRRLGKPDTCILFRGNGPISLSALTLSEVP